MASAYPVGLDTFATNKANATATVTDHPNHHNDLADAVNKIEAELGIAPSAAYATVAARFTGVEAADALTPTVLTTTPFLYWATGLAGTTLVNITGTQTVTADRGLLGVLYQDQTASDLNCHLQAHTFAVGHSFMVPINLNAITFEDFTMAALVFSNGTVAGSSAIAMMYYLHTGGTLKVFEPREGTLTSMATADWTQDVAASSRSSWLYLRMTYQASNSFRLAISWDAINYTSFGQADVGFTLTPTHVGVGWTSWGGTTDAFRSATFGPIYKLA